MYIPDKKYNIDIIMQLIIFIAVSVSIFSKLNTDIEASIQAHLLHFHEVFPTKINGAVFIGINIPCRSGILPPC